MQLSEAKEAWKALAPDCVVDPIDPAMRLRQCRHLRVVQSQNVITEIDAVWRVCAFDEDSAQQLAAIWDLIDETHTVADLMTYGEGDGLQIRDMLQSLYEHGLVINANGTPVPALSFHDHAISIGKMWLALATEKTGFHHALMNKQTTQRLLLGWLVDRYHYIAGTASHVSRAIAHAPSERLELMLSEHLSEEYWHATWLATGLQAAGLTEQDIKAALPLPATLGAINFLRWVASTDILGYFLTLGVRESHATESLEQEQQLWQFWERLDLLPEATLRPYRDHKLIDIAHDHGSISAEAFVGLPPLSERQQLSLLCVLTQFAQQTAESSAGVLRYYENENNPLLCLPTWD
jgi:pyrroloquinoline quinone (PQQ) biosynthesis protein C